MELKAGYKQTEVGVIPTDWKIKEINQICTLSNVRINPLSTVKSYKCIELEHLSQGTGQLLGFTDSYQLKSHKNIFKDGDVLFGKLRPYLKKYYFPNFEGVCTTEIWVLHTSSNVIGKWLYFTVQSDRFLDIASQSTGTKMPRAEWSVVGKALIPFPPTKAEQTAIANALSDADALIQSLTRLIAKKRQIKQATMQILLIGKKRLPMFVKSMNYQNTDIGIIPEDWDCVAMGDIGQSLIGLTYNPSNQMSKVVNWHLKIMFSWIWSCLTCNDGAK